MMNKKIMITFIGVAALMASIVTITTPQAEAQGCADPVEYDEKFLDSILWRWCISHR